MQDMAIVNPNLVLSVHPRHLFLGVPHLNPFIIHADFNLKPNQSAWDRYRFFCTRIVLLLETRTV